MSARHPVTTKAPIQFAGRGFLHHGGRPGGKVRGWIPDLNPKKSAANQEGSPAKDWNDWQKGQMWG